jgi:lipid-A-disaccharide synthase
MSPAVALRLPPPARGRVDVLVIAGEHSGDEHAARMVRGLRLRQPDVTVAALGGPALASAGAQLLHDLTGSSVVGLVEVLRNYGFFRQLFAEILRWVEEHRPRAVCFVDYPGLNLRLAAAMRERGLSRKGGGPTATLYYISPQIWAWKAGRRFAMAQDLDAMAVIFPFEVPCYADTSLAVDFVGHPFVAPGHRSPVVHDPAGPVLLLPGSRRQAVARIFPALLEGYRRFGGREAVVLYPSADILAVLQRFDLPPGLTLRTVAAAEADPVGAAAVLTSSGTMSMQCALAGIPGAIAYRANPVTYLLGRMLVKIEYLGIANLLLGEPMYPEYIQGAAKPEALAAALAAGVNDLGRRAQTGDQARRLRALLDVPAGHDAGGWLGKQLSQCQTL